MTTCVLYFYQLLGFNGYFCSLFFRLHIYKNHTENSQYTCQSCSQDFYDLKKFVLHQIKIHAERNGDHIYCLACRRPYTKSHRWVKYLFTTTLECGINVLARLLIFKFFFQGACSYFALFLLFILTFWPKIPKIMLFRLQYAHFRPLICVSIKFSRGHVYYL